MKNKFLALAAFGTAVLGGAILSAPANAVIPKGSGPSSTINVDVSVPEILFLRTLQNAAVVIEPADFLTGTDDLIQVANSNPPAYQNSDKTPGAAGTALNTESPFSATQTSITKRITNAYIVWSNSPTTKYNVEITVASQFGNLNVTVNDSSNGERNAQGLTGTTASDIDLDIPVSADAPAGTYSGTLQVEAWRP